MTLLQLGAFTLTALGLRALRPGPGRAAARLLASLAALYWLQPPLAIRYLDFWLPTLAIGVSAAVWAACQPRPLPWRAALPEGLVALGWVALVASLRYWPAACCLSTSLPPPLPTVLLGLATLIALIGLLGANRRRAWGLWALTALILALFVVLKSEPLGRAVSALLRGLMAQPPELAAALDLRWLGISYLAFRWLHVLRDAQAGKLPPSSLGEFLSYALFFPAYSAGPIDRLPHALSELRAPAATVSLLDGAERLFLGVFKKFVLADTLTLVALNPQSAAQVQASGWMWLLLYAYALRIYWDFSGYSDIAIGLAGIIGLRLPENFDRPYQKTNLTAFWNSWHMTLAGWFRAYFFFPVTRALRLRQAPTWLVLLVGQGGVMLLIGLWHGITVNFALWGLWHALGLFAHNRWSDWLRGRDFSPDPRQERLLRVGGWLLTFHYVALGWVWFTLPTPQLALHTFAVLLGGR